MLHLMLDKAKASLAISLRLVGNVAVSMRLALFLEHCLIEW